MFTTALFIVSKIWTQSKHPLMDAMDKEMEYHYSAMTKNENEILSFATTWMHLEGIIY